MGYNEGTGEMDGDGGATSHGGRPRRTRKKESKKKERSFWKELPLLILIALVLALLIKIFFVQAFSIPSESMQNTLQVGDRVVVDKLTPWFGATPKRGEVVVFEDPDHWLGTQPPKQQNPVVEGFQWAMTSIGLMPSDDEKDLIKRVMAVGGDTIECKGKGPVRVNGKALHEPYIYPGSYPCSDMPIKKTVVPKGKLWVMGDHRNDSQDSRWHTNKPGHGFVPEKDVVGRAFAVAWPINRWSTMQVPSTFSHVPSGSGQAAGAVSVAPDALSVAGVLPLVWWRRRWRYSPGDAASCTVSAAGPAGGRAD